MLIIHAASGSCRRLAMKVLVTTSFSPVLLQCIFSLCEKFLTLVLLFLGLNNLLMAYEDKSAYALCAFSFSLGPNTEPITFLGKTPVWYLLFFLHISIGGFLLFPFTIDIPINSHDVKNFVVTFGACVCMNVIFGREREREQFGYSYWVIMIAFFLLVTVLYLNKTVYMVFGPMAMITVRVLVPFP